MVAPEIDGEVKVPLVAVGFTRSTSCIRSRLFVCATALYTLLMYVVLFAVACAVCEVVPRRDAISAARRGCRAERLAFISLSDTPLANTVCMGAEGEVCAGTGTITRSVTRSVTILSCGTREGAVEEVAGVAVGERTASLDSTSGAVSLPSVRIRSIPPCRVV